ncbi:MAG: PqqD family protein [Marinilabiliales bacterium]
MKIKLTDKVGRHPDMLYSQLDDEIVMMSIENGEYYGLNEIASRIWELLKKDMQVSDIISELMNEYEVDEETCKNDVFEFLSEMMEKKLIQIKQ